MTIRYGFRRFDERALHYFNAVCESGSIRAAAEELRISPSAISRKLAEMEIDFGIALLQKTSRGVKPTDAGRRVAQHIRKRNRRDRDLLLELTGTHGLLGGEVRIVCGEGFLTSLLEDVLPNYLNDNPNVTVHVDTAGTDEIVDMVLKDECDIGIVFNPPHLPLINVAISATHPLCVVCEKAHELANREALRLRDIEAYPIATLGTRFGVAALLESVKRLEGLKLQERMISNSIHALRLFIANTSGVTCLPKFALSQKSIGTSIIAIPLTDELLSSVRAEVVNRRDRLLSPAVKLLVERIGQQLSAFRENPEAC